MPITSLDYLMKRNTNGFTYKSNWQFFATKNNPHQTGLTYETSTMTGIWGSLTSYSGNRTWQSCNSASGFNSVILPPSNLISSNETLHISYVSAMTASTTGVPGLLTLVDLQGYWANIVANTTSTQNLTGTPGSNLRYTNGEGCRLYGSINTSSFSFTNFITSLAYTTDTGSSNNTNSSFSIDCNSATGNSSIISFNPGRTGSTLFFPIAQNFNGVQNVSSIAFGTNNPADTGIMTLSLVKPILSIPISAIGIATEKNFVSSLTSMPEVKKDACLIWLYTAGAATARDSAFYGRIEFVWG